MAFSFEDLHAYKKALGFYVSVINAIDNLETPINHYRLIEQLGAACTSVPNVISLRVNDSD